MGSRLLARLSAHTNSAIAASLTHCLELLGGHRFKSRTDVLPRRSTDRYVNQRARRFATFEAKGCHYSRDEIFYIRVGIDRISCRSAIIVSNSDVFSTSPSSLPARSDVYAFPSSEVALTVTDEARAFLSTTLAVQDTVMLEKHVQLLSDLFGEEEAINLSTVCKFAEATEGSVMTEAAYFEFDDAAYRTNRRLQGEGLIGTLVNGAGLAMDAV
ncbi:hypothetical protein KEM56_002767 [Ascosphaera pollenicola]|nr:hypothetical protein KEM56_002767 [Ascosphaera pollenicola]